MEDARSGPDKMQAEGAEFGRRLGLLLATAEMPDEQKAAWASLVPEMDVRQMADLADALSRRIPDAEERAFSELAVKLREATGRYDDRVAEATVEAQQALSDVEAELDPPTP